MKARITILRSPSAAVLIAVTLGALVPLLLPHALNAASSPEGLAVEYTMVVLAVGYALIQQPLSASEFLAGALRFLGLAAIGLSLSGVLLEASPVAAATGVVGSTLLILSAAIREEGHRGLLDYAAASSIDDVMAYALLVALGAIIGAGAGNKVLAALLEVASMLPAYELVSRYSRRSGLDVYEKMLAASLFYASAALAALALLS